MMHTIYFIVTGLLIYSVFRLLIRLLRAASGTKMVQKWMLKVVPFIELLAWVAYTFWAVALVFGRYRYYEMVVGAMAVLLVLVTAWYVFRDFLTGVLLKADAGIEPGKAIKTPVVEGKILSLGYRSMVLINEKGEKVVVPYSRLRDQPLTLIPEEDQQLPHQCRMLLPAEADPLLVRRQVRELMMALPWVAEPEPEISIEKDVAGSIHVLVRYHTHTNIHATQVEKKLRSMFPQQAS